MYTHGWFMLRIDRKQQNSVKQLSFNKKKIKRKNNLNLHLNELEEEPMKPKVSRKKGITKIRAEISETETKNKIGKKINETKNQFLEKIKLTNFQLYSQKKKKMRTQINKIRN